MDLSTSPEMASSTSGLDVIATRDLHGRFQRESPCKPTQSIEDAPLRVSEQLVPPAPIAAVIR